MSACVSCKQESDELGWPEALGVYRGQPGRYCGACIVIGDQELAAAGYGAGAVIHRSAPAQPSLKSRLLTPQQLRERPRPKHLIKGVLRLNSATWLIAAPASYKSFMALDWAAHVASGQEWNGRRTEQRDVIYVLAEGADGFQDRVTAWEIRHATALDNLYVLPVAVQARGDDNRSVSTQWRELVTLVAEMQPGLVVLDTQARLTVGLEENSNSEMGVWVEAVDMLKRAADCCVLVVHHTGRTNGDARGASAIDGAQDQEWRIDRDSERLCTLKCDKNKDGPDDLKWTFPLDIVDVDHDEDGEKVTSLVLGKPIARRGSEPATAQVELTAAEGRMTDCYGLVHRILGELDPHREGMSLTEINAAAVKARKAAKLEPFARESIRSALNKGREQSAVEKIGRSNWTLAGPSAEVLRELAETVAGTVGRNGLPNGSGQRSATVGHGSALPLLGRGNIVSANG